MTAHPTLQAAAHREPTCDARTGEQAGDYGFTPLWCHQTRGLRSYVDRTGMVRRFCANHERAVRSRYPEAELPEAEDPITAYKVEQERQGLR
jgi:hypothetical protein